MRCFKLLLMGGIVLALAVPASAITLVLGENNFDIVNRDNGALYNMPAGKGAFIGNPNNVAAGVGLLDLAANVFAPAAGGKAGTIGASEDSWGIARTDLIRDISANIIWNGTTANTELTWVFYGAEDFYAENLDNAGTVRVQSVNLFAELYEEPLAGGTPIDLTQGSTNRGVAPNVYTSATEGTMLLQLRSTAGFIHVPGDFGGALTEFETDFNPGSNTGAGLAYFDVVGGTMQIGFDQNSISSPASLANGMPNADAMIQFGSYPTTDGPNPSGAPVGPPPFDWLVRSDDPLRTDYVPEPITMAGLLLGIGCLGRYVRRRR